MIRMRPAAVGGIGSSSTFLPILGTAAGAGKPTAPVSHNGGANTYFGDSLRWTLSACRPQTAPYIFTVYALKADLLSLKPQASRAMVGYYLNQNALAKASFTGLYSRK